MSMHGYTRRRWRIDVTKSTTYSDSDDLHRRGVELAQVGEYSQAARLIQQAIDSDVDDSGSRPMYYSNLGSVLHAMGDLARAIDAHRQAIAIGEQFLQPAAQRAWHHYNLGSVYASSGRWREAASAYRRAIELDATSVVAVENLATVLQNQGQFDDAEAMYRRALSLSPERVGVHRNLGSLYARTGSLEQAEASYRRALAYTESEDAPEAMHPSAAECARLAAAIFMDLGAVQQTADRLDDALASYRRAGELTPRDSTPFTRCGVVLVALGELAAAERAHRRAVALSPVDAAAHNALGASLASLGRYDEAAQVLARSVELDPDNVHAHYNLGVVCHRQGALERSADAYRAALALAPDHAAAWGNLADCLRRLERFDEAVAAYEQRLRREPDDPSAIHLIRALRGHVSTAPPDGYVQQIFDDYAPRFDQHLTEQLAYRVPEHIGAAIDDVAPSRRFATALDLGCGTGLLGQQLRARCDVLHGVDVSRGMLARADEKAVYDRLRAADLAVFLADVAPLGTRVYDLITAADVLIYVGALAGVFAGVAACLAPGGLFAFTIERAESADCVLRSTGRYAHSRSYIAQLAGDHGLRERAARDIVLRQEHDHPESGILYIFEQPRDR